MNYQAIGHAKPLAKRDFGLASATSENGAKFVAFIFVAKACLRLAAPEKAARHGMKIIRNKIVFVNGDGENPCADNSFHLGPEFPGIFGAPRSERRQETEAVFAAWRKAAYFARHRRDQADEKAGARHGKNRPKLLKTI